MIKKVETQSYQNSENFIPIYIFFHTACTFTVTLLHLYGWGKFLDVVVDKSYHLPKYCILNAISLDQAKNNVF